MTGSKTTHIEKALLLAWFVVSLIVGVLTVREYGMSIDEPNNYRYAADTLDAYPSLFGILYEPKYDSTYDGHGPAFVLLAGSLIRLVRAVFPNGFEPDLWHYSYFVTFLVAGLSLYWLTKRWFSTWTAWAILILFTTQPLLLGQSFINPKDIPFLSFLTLSIVLGFHLVDGVIAKEPSVSLERPVANLRAKFGAVDQHRRKRFVTAFIVTVAAVMALTVFSSQVNSLIGQAVTFFYTAGPDSWAGRTFASLASPAPGVPVDNYVTKAVKLFNRVELGILVTGIVFFATYFGLLISNLTPRTFLNNTWKRRHELATSVGNLRTSLSTSVNVKAVKTWFTDLLHALRDPRLIFAGLALGLATGVRAIAPYVGVIVVLYLFAKLRSSAWTIAIAYFLVAGIVTYLVWPRLWDAPVRRYLEGLGVISNFTHFPGRVLFGGEFYGPGELPRSYLPVLLNIQFTEPLLLAIYAGIAILVWRLLRKSLRIDLLLYIGLGFGLPLLGLILLRPPLYHNFRQALFLIPPMIMLAAFPLDLLFSRVTQSWARVLAIAALALPGVYATVKLFPYQYVYYNSLVGGPAGALNHYELDYWRISLREAALQLNELAPQGSVIVVTRSAGLLARYTRPDLIVDKPIDSILDLDSGYDYVVQVARWERWDLYPEVENVVTIERDGLILATTKYVKNLTLK